jgi:DNA ligase 1
VAVIALTEGSAGLAQFQLQVGQPLAPMLASSAADLSSALSKISPAVIEEKIDGMRVQVHRNQDDITVFTRTLDVITDRVPEIVAAVRELPTQSIVLDGEAVVLHTDQRPQPFQITASRMGSHEVTQTSVSVFFFDLLHADGVDLLDAPAAERFAALTNIVPPYLLIRQITTADLSTAEGFLAETLRRGHEGVMVKSPDMPYAVGRRGASWLKVKPVHTLDLVVLAAEWGHGRRQGWLSNIHLGAYDPNGDFGEPGGFVMLGKTFKGMTDQMLTWQTEYFKKIAQSTVDNYVVRVKPQLVVEVAFDGVQGSTRYPGGVALRFARVKGYRLDKAPESADTITTVRGFLTG